MTSDNLQQNTREVRFNKIAELLQASRDGTEFSAGSKTELNELLRASEENRNFAAQYLLDNESLRELLASEEISAISTGHFPKPDSRGKDPLFQAKLFLSSPVQPRLP